MCLHPPTRNPLHCIIPAHILRAIAENGTPEQRSAALATLGIDNSIRSVRAQAAVARAYTPSFYQRLLDLGFAESAWASLLEPEPDRVIYDAGNSTRLPGRKVRAEGDPATNDPAVDEAYDGLGATFALFSEVYGRNSIDNNGMTLQATVHYGQGYDNAFWDGRQMVFGDGNVFNRFTSAIDVIGHELAHGVTERSARLVYLAQPGALNEHVSDVFGSLVKQRSRGESVDQADWLIGAELLAGTNIQGVALRSMENPGEAYDDPLLGGKDPQPSHMDDYVRGPEDNFGVHINSGICNRAFFLAATNIGGNAWDEAGLVWYETLINPSMSPWMRFSGFAWLTVMTATQLFGPESDVPQAIREGWREVGVLR